MRRLSLFFFFLFISFAQDGIFVKGNDAYQNNNYKQALEYYQQILDNEMESSALYFNMGNSHFKMENLGEAILFYEKAKKLDPLDEAIKANLDLANDRVLDDIAEQDQMFIFDIYNQLKFALTINQMLWITLCCFALFFMGLWLKKWILPFLETVMNGINIVTLVLFLFWSALSFARIANIEEKRGVVITQTSEVYTSPNENNQVFVLHEGTQFKIERELNSRYEITLIDGKTGWIDITSVGVI